MVKTSEEVARDARACEVAIYRTISRVRGLVQHADPALRATLSIRDGSVTIRGFMSEPTAVALNFTISIVEGLYGHAALTEVQVPGGSMTPARAMVLALTVQRIAAVAVDLEACVLALQVATLMPGGAGVLRSIIGDGFDIGAH